MKSTLLRAVFFVLCSFLPIVSWASPPIYQLRIYEIFDHNKAAFHERFRDHAQRIMRDHDFDIVAMWETKTERRTEFVYILRWPDEASMKKAWRGFMVNTEWSDIKKRTTAQHGQLVGDIEDRTLHLLDYSPAPPHATTR